MRTAGLLTSIAVLFAPQVILADWTTYTASCTTGFSETFGDGFGSGSAGTESTGVCDGAYAEASSEYFQSGNPCDIGGQMFNYYQNGDVWDVYPDGGDGNSIGQCHRTSGDFEACSDWNYSCLYYPDLYCSSSYCS